ncbi:hypothetical protein LUZ60_016248 [Juncus effusus]|nr:hypothetical protein LUZ60_016248 [Juncus effusus]
MANPEESKREWEEARCPICMEHPHNAVRLLCSNANCLSFLCDTSSLLSDCLHRFTSSSDQSTPCPLCRGSVIGWKIDGEARAYMDLKSRACSGEGCEFEGNYEELRSHVREAHPLDRPGVVDPARQSRWDRLESQHELDDVITAIRSAVPGAVVMGDYAVEPGSQDDDEPGSQEDQETVVNAGVDGHGPWWTELVLFDVVGSHAPAGAARTRSRRPSSSSRYLWGENLLGLRYDDDDDDDDEEEEEEEEEESYVDGADERHVARRRLDGDQDVHSRRRRNLDDREE